MSGHQWVEESTSDNPYTAVYGYRCSRCGVDRLISVNKDAYGIANGVSLTLYRAPGENDYGTEVEPPCKWEIAGALASDRDSQGKARPFAPLYLGIEAEHVEVARCWVDCPDGKRRRVRVYVNAIAALDQALATLPYNSTTYTSGGIRMTWSEVEG